MNRMTASTEVENWALSYSMICRSLSSKEVIFFVILNGVMGPRISEINTIQLFCKFSNIDARRQLQYKYLWTIIS